MPYRKSKKPHEKVERLLNSYKINAPALARALGCAVSTARIKLNEPERITLKDLTNIHKNCHISWEQIREAIGD